MRCGTCSSPGRRARWRAWASSTFLKKRRVMMIRWAKEMPGRGVQAGLPAALGLRQKRWGATCAARWLWWILAERISSESTRRHGKSLPTKSARAPWA